MKTKPNVNTRSVAARIAVTLTTNGNGENARRLQLRGPNEEDLGGWCISALVDTIADVLKKELKAK